MTKIQKSLITTMNSEFRMLLEDNNTVIGKVNTLGTPQSGREATAIGRMLDSYKALTRFQRTGQRKCSSHGNRGSKNHLNTQLSKKKKKKQIIKKTLG